MTSSHPFSFILKKFSAAYIFTCAGSPVKDGTVLAEDDGTIVDVIKTKEEPGAVVFNGIICPGFVNAHCHLELSHLKGKIPEQTGIDVFIQQIESGRKTDEEEIEKAAQEADAEMYRNGIAAAGDISNTSHSFSVKSKSKIYYHTFIELLGFHPSRAEKAFDIGLELLRQIRNPQSAIRNSSLTPHAPYSASQPLLKLISDYAVENNTPLTIHNQESEEENLLFKNKTGKILQRLEVFGIGTDFIIPSGKSSLMTVLPQLPAGNKIQLVHNIVTTKEEIEWANSVHKNLYWCFCPNANLYIENKLPTIENFVSAGCRITIGTDSLASNKQLSILDEMKTIQENFPSVRLEEMISWSTKNGSEFLGVEKKFGTIEKGKKPGLLLIDAIRNEDLKLSDESKALRLI